MKLLIVTQTVDSSDPILGFFHRWLVEFAGRVDALTVIANRVGEHQLPANVTVYSLGKERGAGRIARYGRFFQYVIRNMRYADAVFVHMIPLWVVLLYPIAFMLRKPIYLWYTHKSVTLSLRLATWCAKKVFTASEESFRIATPKKNIVGHAIDTDLFTPGTSRHDPKTLRLLTIARITPVKDLPFIFNALKMLQTNLEMKSQFIHLTIIGAPQTKEDVAYEKEIFRMASEIYPPAGRSLTAILDIDIVGKKMHTELPALYRAHDVFLHASETGSLDKVVLEAMACAVPVVTTSEAFRGILPEKYYSQKDTRVFAEKVTAFRDGARDPALRDIVVKNHNLVQTIRRIVNIINED